MPPRPIFDPLPVSNSESELLQNRRSNFSFTKMVDMQNSFQDRATLDRVVNGRPQLLPVSFDNKRSQLSGDTYYER